MKTYTPELKAQILKEVSETKNIMLVAKNHNINHKTVWNWVHGSKTKVESLKLKRVMDLERRLVTRNWRSEF